MTLYTAYDDDPSWDRYEARARRFEDWRASAAPSTLGSQQRTALNRAIDWLDGARTVPVAANQIFRIFGYAGSGKTHTAREIARQVEGTVIFAAYTGKAASVLRGRGCVDAQTIHSLIYAPVHVSKAEIEAMRKEIATSIMAGDMREAERLSVRLADAQNKGIRFELNDESDLVGASLLIVDEVSMVDETLARDLLSFGVPLLVLGDPEQLPPINGPGVLVAGEPDVMLTEIHRQAADSPILSLATHVREHGDIPAAWKTPLWLSQVPIGAQVLCGRNATRWAVTSALRALRGRPHNRPEVGDRIIVLKNNRELNVFNGQQFIVAEAPAPMRGVITLSVLDDGPDPYVRKLDVYAQGFYGPEGEAAASKAAARGGLAAAATFAECCTVHKFQGSEAADVYLIDEGWVFARQDPDTPRRWRYTGCTRASNILHVSDGWSM